MPSRVPSLFRRRFRPERAGLALLLTIPTLASAEPFERYERAFGTLSLGMAGGFQVWALDGIQAALDSRAGFYAQDGYRLDGGDFGTTYGYGLELQVRLTDHYFFRTQAEWTRMNAESRDRQFLSTLGGRARTPVSIGYTTRVQTRPMLFSLGLGRSHRFNSVRWGLSGSWIIAPVKVIDEMELFMEASTVSKIESTGVGQGAEAVLSLDYFTDSNMTLYVETYARRGAAVVELESAAWETTIVPGRRRVDLDSAGIRLGFRWI